jgi:hypothetical protein
MQEESISKLCKEVIVFFKQTIVDVGKAAKFVKRKSKLTAQLFAETLIIGCLSDNEVSLERQCRLIKRMEVKISKQGLHQRFNDAATELMRCLFTKSLKKFETRVTDVPELLKPFSEVKIRDSTAISLPESLKKVFKGYGGAASDAGLKIQLLFNYVQGQIGDVVLTDGCRSDQGFSGQLDITRDALYLQDLGYFKVKLFKKIQDQGAYFISRYLYPTGIYNKDGTSIGLFKELKKAGCVFTKKVWLGSKDKIEVKLTAKRLPLDIVVKRICKIKRDAKRRRKGVSKEMLELANWSIYITNIEENILSDEQIHLIYSLRWQIELFFKLCKSEAGIDKISSKKTDRILCEIYAKLICVVNLLYLCFPVKWQEGCEISYYKAYRAMRLRAMEFFLALNSLYRLIGFIKSFISDLKDFALKDRYRIRRQLTYQKILRTVGQKACA